MFGAALGAFAVAVQLVLSGWLLVQGAGASPADLNQADLAVVCSHDPAATTDDTGVPPPPHQHNQCPACTCPQSAKLLAALPMPALFVVLRPRSQAPQAFAAVFAAKPRSPSPYASRAPPFSA